MAQWVDAQCQVNKAHCDVTHRKPQTQNENFFKILS